MVLRHCNCFLLIIAQQHKTTIITMKNLFLSVLMLTGIAAFAQEPVKQTTTQTTTNTTQTQQLQQPAQNTQAATVKQAKLQPSAAATTTTTERKSEAVVKEEKVTEKKAQPAKKTN